jgi:hypothetical protein
VIKEINVSEESLSDLLRGIQWLAQAVKANYKQNSLRRAMQFVALCPRPV